MRCSLQDVFAKHFDAYAQAHTLHPRESRAAWCIRHCFRPALGYHVLECPAGHHSVTQFHACRHRSCPRCAERPRQQWLASLLQHLLPCPHFHVVFTLPHELIPLWQFNRAWMNQLLFDSARLSLLELCADPRHLGATPALLMALHTWGRTLSRHPHVHCLVSAGGLDPAAQWRACRPAFLLPLRPLQQLFRGKLLAGLRRALHEQRLTLPPEHNPPHWRHATAALYRKHFNIQINPPYAHGRAVALYLARYVKGGPLGSQRALDLDNNTVAFAYLDHRDQQRKTLRLQAAEFISRTLWHAPPRGQHTVRRAGLYASAQHRQYQQCQQALSPPLEPTPHLAQVRLAFPPTPPTPPTASCPECQQPLQRRLIPPARLHSSHQFGEFSNPALPTPSQPGPTLRSTGRARASPGHAG